MIRPKILSLDIETAPMKAYVWGVYDQVVDYRQVFSYSYMLCWSAKWYGDKKIMSDALPFHDLYKKEPTNDKLICESVRALMEEADFVIAHNGDNFDIKKLNMFFLKNGLGPVNHFRTIDTKKISKSVFGFPSNKLDALTRELGIGNKLQHEGFSLWPKCMAGDKKAWKTMVEYNKKDVKLVEEYYSLIKPFIKNHPDMRVFSGKDTCPSCMSKDYRRMGFRYLNSGKFERLICNNCGKDFKGAKCE